MAFLEFGATRVQLCTNEQTLVRGQDMRTDHSRVLAQGHALLNQLKQAFSPLRHILG